MLTLILIIIMAIFLAYRLYKILGSEEDNAFFTQKNNITKNLEIELKTETHNEEEDTALDADSRNNLIEIRRRVSKFNTVKFIQIVNKIVTIVIDNLNQKSNNEEVSELMTESFLEEFKDIKSKLSGHIYLISIEDIKILNIKKVNTDTFCINTRINMTQQAQDVAGKISKIKTVENWQFVNFNGEVNWQISDIIHENVENPSF